MTTQTRIQLALAACQGLTDEDLQQRGPGGFKAMIERKRKYASAARTLNIIAASLHKQVQQAADTLTELDSLDAIEPKLGDISQAAAMLAAIGGKK